MKICRNIKGQRGVTAIVVAIVLPVLIAVVALAVDVGYLAVTKNELQNIADASALAGARQLGSIYQTMSYEDQQIYVCDPAPIKDMAKEIASKNRAGGKDNIIIDDGDIIIGDWDGATLTPTLAQPDAVEVTARRDGGANGPIVTFFARIFGIDTADVVADATAALTGKLTAGPGGLPIPFGISEHRFDIQCGEIGFIEDITLYPTSDPDSCGGWHTYTESPANADKLTEILEGLKDETYISPETTSGETEFSFTGGTLASVFDEMKALFDTMKVKNDGMLDSDEDSGTWTTTVAVYESDDCSNPNRSLMVKGFSEVTITEVLESPEHTINGKIRCDYVEAGRGSGGEYGTKGEIPGLVE